jgi:hypothetical protein
MNLEQWPPKGRMVRRRPPKCNRQAADAQDRKPWPKPKPSVFDWGEREAALRMERARLECWKVAKELEKRMRAKE